MAIRQQITTTQPTDIIIIIIMYFYHALINALSAHMIHINLANNYKPINTTQSTDTTSH